MILNKAATENTHFNNKKYLKNYAAKYVVGTMFLVVHLYAMYSMINIYLLITLHRQLYFPFILSKVDL